MKKGLLQKVDKYMAEARYVTREQLGLAVGMMEMCFAGRDDSSERRHSLMMYLFGVEHAKDLLPSHVLALLDWLKPERDSGGAYAPDPVAISEAQSVVVARMKELGQEELTLGQKLGLF